MICGPAFEGLMHLDKAMEADIVTRFAELICDDTLGK